MKTFISALIFGLTSAVAGTPVEKLAPIDHVYAPNGFDSNDNVEIVVTGYLPNLCHKSPKSKIEIKGGKIKVKVTSLFYAENSPFCPEMVVPFTEKVSLGLLKEGSYNIVVNDKSDYKKTASVTVAAASANTVDSHNYAYVDYIEKRMDSDVVALKGYHVSDCFVLDRIEHFNNGKDTYSILPILKQINEFCPKKLTPFKYEFQVPTELKTEKTLLHVRTLNGSSVNTIFIRK